MSNVLDITDTMMEGFNFVTSRILDGRYNEAIVVIKDILDAYNAINSQINTFIRYLPQNNILILMPGINKIIFRSY